MLLFTLVLVPIHAQYTIDKSAGRLHLYEINAVTLEGHTGNTILIEPEGSDYQLPDRAKGLKVLSPSGLTDNTGLGLSVHKEGDETIVAAISSRSDQRYTIKVPSGVSVYYECTTHEGETLVISDVASEVEASVNFNDVEIVNASGPLAISTVHGSIMAEFDAVGQEHAIRLSTVHNHVDVTVPETTKANFHLGTQWGEMFTDLDLEIEDAGNMRRVSAHSIDAKYNGGGVEFVIRSTHDDVYLRKK